MKMTLWILLLPLFISTCQCSGDVQDRKEIENTLKSLLLEKLESIKSIKDEVEDLTKKVENDMKNYELEVSNLRKELPKNCLHMLNDSPTTTPCVNTTTLVSQLRKALDDATKLAEHAFFIFSDTFNDPKYSCTATNPFSALRCFLSVFRVAYDNLQTLHGEVTQLLDDARKAYDDYSNYLDDCKPNHKLQLMSQALILCKEVQH